MHKKSRILGVITLVSLFLTPSMASAGPRLVWDPSSGTVSGYRIYYEIYDRATGTETVPPEMQGVGNVTEYPLDNLPLEENKTYYFYVKAYNSAGESGPSNKVYWDVPDATAPMPPQGISIQ